MTVTYSRSDIHFICKLPSCSELSAFFHNVTIKYIYISRWPFYIHVNQYLSPANAYVFGFPLLILYRKVQIKFISSFLFCFHAKYTGTSMWVILFKILLSCLFLFVYAFFVNYPLNPVMYPKIQGIKIYLLNCMLQVTKALDFGNGWVRPGSLECGVSIDDPEPCQENDDFLFAQDACFIVLDPEGTFPLHFEFLLLVL